MLKKGPDYLIEMQISQITRLPAISPYLEGLMGSWQLTFSNQDGDFYIALKRLTPHTKAPSGADWSNLTTSLNDKRSSLTSMITWNIMSANSSDKAKQ